MSDLKRLSTFSHPVSLLVWLVLQLLVLLIPVTQLPLSEEFARPAEKLAIEEMVIAQMALSALLAPILFPTWASILVIAAASWPFLQLAGILSSTPPHRILEGSAFISIWIASIGILVAGATSTRFRTYCVAVASTFAVGGAITAYLRAEFGVGEASPLMFGPIVGALDVIHAESSRIGAWIFLLLILFISVAIRFTFAKLHRRLSRQVIHNFGG